MQGKQFKLIYFSLGGSEVKEICIGWKTILGVAALTLTVLLILTAGIISVFTDVFHDYHLSRLSKANSELTDQLFAMSDKVNSMVEIVNNIEKQDNDLRVFVDLPAHSVDTQKLGVGGRSDETYTTSSLDSKIREKAFEVNQEIEQLTRRLQYAKSSRDEIQAKYTNDINILNTTPSIRPLIGGRVTAGYGFRIDPFTEKIKAHEGIDISSPRGTPIYATAAGRVLEVRSRYIPNRNYGKYIIIDHGNGLETRYAHLSRILVKEGQKVDRHDVIGLVGDTGRSTGPHLHYEVLKNNRAVNPAYFILE